MLHNVRKSLQLTIFIGLILLLKLLSCSIEFCKSCLHFGWRHLSENEIPASAGLYLALDVQDGTLILLLFLLWLVGIFVYHQICISLAYCDFCVAHTQWRKKRAITFVANPAFGGRGQEIRRSRKHSAFDSTLGYPGEGWKDKLLSMATWLSLKPLRCSVKICKSC